MSSSVRGLEIQPLSLGLTPRERDSDVIKFGVTTPLRSGDNAGGELIELSPNDSLSQACVVACNRWGLSEPSNYALAFKEPPYHYVTEGQRKSLSGKLVQMIHAPGKVSREIVEKMREGGGVMLVGLKDLALKSSDPTLATVFMSHDGLGALIGVLEQNKVSDEQGLQYVFQGLLDVITNSNTSWDKVPSSVLAKIIQYVNSHKGSSQERLGLKYALQILENAAMIPSSFEQIEKEVALESLKAHLYSQDKEVQQNILSFFNTLLSKAEGDKKKIFLKAIGSKDYRNVILDTVIKRDGRPAETSYQLYVLQTYLLSSLDERKSLSVGTKDTLDRIKELCRIAFDAEESSFSSSLSLDSNSSGKREKYNYAKDFKKIGFQNVVNPNLDFSTIPPGLLALDCMFHLAKTQYDTYKKLIIECTYRGSGEDYLLPFARASITLTSVLCDLLHVGEAPGDQGGKFYQFFFQLDKPFEEIFCICIQLVTKTWKEMRATVEDFDKVFDVVKEQIRRSLDDMPENLHSFQLRLHELTFSEITNLRAQERSSREEGELQAEPIKELRNKITPEIIELIKQNRINFLISGTRFNKFASKGLVSATATTLKRIKEKFWYCRLSPNEKTFHYGDCEEKASPMPEMLSSKLAVVDIKELVTRKECPHMKESKKKGNFTTAFSLIIEKDPLISVDFIAPDQKTFDFWTDGINALLGKPMVSDESKTDLDILLSMELKLRLLDIEGLTIPHEPPPIPPLPTNFDFPPFK